MSKPRSACRSNVRRDGLTPGQERAIQAMLTARSIAAAARQADVGQSTLRRWIREDDNFQNKLRQLREQALSHAALLLQQAAAGTHPSRTPKRSRARQQAVSASSLTA